MSKETIKEPEQTEIVEEVVEPMTIQELLSYAVQDAIAGESAEPLTETFFDEFVSQNREETPQILMFLDMSNEDTIELLVQSQMQSVEMLKQNAPKFLRSCLKTIWD